MSELLKQTDSLWSGQATTAEPAFHPFAPLRVLEELAPGVAFYKGFVNITGVKTGEGLVLVDTGSYHPVAHQRRTNVGEVLLGPGAEIGRIPVPDRLDELVQQRRVLRIVHCLPEGVVMTGSQHARQTKEERHESIGNEIHTVDDPV